MIANCPRLPPLQFSQQFWVEDHTHAKDVMRRFICKAFYKGVWYYLPQTPKVSYLQPIR